MPAERPLSADAVARAPLPHLSENYREAPPTSVGQKLLWVPRVVLFVPRWAAEVAFAPLRGAAYLWERYDLGERAQDLFFNDARTFGIYPTLVAQSGFGSNVGGRLVYRNIFAAGEDFSASFGYGGRFAQTYYARFDSGRRFGKLRFTLDGGYLIGQNERFFGFGNGDLTGAPAAPQSALERGPAHPAAYRYDRGYSTLAARLQLHRGLSVTVRGRLIRQTFFDDNSEYGTEAIQDVFQPSTLVGFDGDLINLGGSAELRWDRRRRRGRHVPLAMYSSGPLVTARVGFVGGFGPDPARYGEYLLDARYLLDLFEGTRVLTFRLRAEGVTAGLDHVPFNLVPNLGGPTLLRGYIQGRFHDRHTLLGTLEHRWTVTRDSLAYLFVDTGRVYGAFESFSLSNTRLGFGGGFVYHRGGINLQVQVAGSRDGDVRIDLTF